MTSVRPASDEVAIVVKVGGGALEGGALEDLPGLLRAGVSAVLVHGGGPSLSRMLERLDIPTRFHEGLRVTDERTLEVAEMVFAGSVNKSLARELNALGVPAVGISGADGPTLRVEPIAGLGRVGEVKEVDVRLLKTLSGGGFVPLLAPLGIGPEGAYNVNADAAATAIATTLGAKQLFFMTDVDGFIRDGEVVHEIEAAECESYIESGLAAGGMAPKLRAAAKAAKTGVGARIINGNHTGVLTAALAGDKVGTLITTNDEGTA